jgi:hypothetical protein
MDTGAIDDRLDIIVLSLSLSLSVYLSISVSSFLSISSEPQLFKQCHAAAQGIMYN